MPANQGHDGRWRAPRGNLRQFWDRVTEGLQLNQLWFQFRQDALQLDFWQRARKTYLGAGR